MKKFKALLVKGIVLIAILVIFIVLIALKNNKDVAEAITRGPARWYGFVVSKISGIAPFISFTELLFVALFCIAVLLIVLFIIDLVKLRIIRGFNKLLDIAIIALSVVTLYHFSCEAAYNRKQMPLPYYENDVEREEYVAIYNYFANDLNYCISQLEFKEDGDVKSPMSLQEITKEVKKAYGIVIDSYFASHNGAVKPMISSFIYREFQITGVTFGPFAESNVNTLNVAGDIPFTVAHELAHTKGVMREDDANILAFYVCLNSENTFLRFSAYNRYFYTIRKLNSSLYMSDEERASLVAIDNAYFKHMTFQNNYWDEHDLLGNFADWINNLYIKSSGVEEGTSSYQGGTTDVTDPELRKITSFSTVQKLFLEKYYRS